MGIPATAQARWPQSSQVRGPIGRMLVIPCRFTTGADSGGSPALAYDYNGRLTLTLTEGSPDQYILNVGQYVRLLAVDVSHGLEATVATNRTGSATAGTVTISVATNALASATVDVVIYIQTSES